MHGTQRSVIAALVFFATWAVATWFFEGRIGTLLRPDAVADRIVYALVVNLLLGVIGGIVLVATLLRHTPIAAQKWGFGPGKRTLASIGAGLLLGTAAYVLQGAPSLNPVVIGNAFAQVFVVSTAEVVVCWAVVGTAIRTGLRRHGAIFATVVAAVTASALFGVYHYGHSAPFNTLPVVALLSIVGLVTSAFFFVARDVAGTVVFHNFLGTFGVIKALAEANALAPLEEVQPALIGTALLTAAVLAAGYRFLRVRNARQQVISVDPALGGSS
jgi:hypothetical protein